MATNRGLGKGLAALFSEIENESVTSYDESGNLNSGVAEISIAMIDSNTAQPRKAFDETSLAELSQSIKIHGVIIPIIVTKNGNRYVIVAGERRYRASKLAGLTSIPCLIREYNEKQRKEIALIENIQREDLNPMEEALAFKTLLDEYKITQDELASTIGKSRPVISNTVRLLNLCEDVQNMLISKTLSAGHGRTLVVVTDPEAQLKLATVAVDKKLSVSELQLLINNFLTTKSFEDIKKKNIPLTDNLKSLKKNMTRLFGARINIKGSEEKGKISISFNNKEQLDTITAIIESLKD